MRRCETKARLYLDDVEVGTILVHGFDDAWGFGDFVPDEPFMRFAPLFRRWAQLMHADDVGDPVCAETSDGLREVECAIDAVRAKLHLTAADEWRTITQLNIDGPLVEWREDLHAPCARPARRPRELGCVTT